MQRCGRTLSHQIRHRLPMGRMAAKNYIHLQVGKRRIQQRFERPTGEIVWIHTAKEHGTRRNSLRTGARIELGVFRPQQGVMRSQQLSAVTRH